jgi:hypothetical protein
MTLTPHATIPNASTRTSVDGKHELIKLKTATATFSLRPIIGQSESYFVQVTPKELPASFKNSGTSIFGWFRVQRLPGRNAVLRPSSCAPLHGNAVLMWPNVATEERVRCFDYVEKLIRNEIPKIKPAEQAPVNLRSAPKAR